MDDRPVQSKECLKIAVIGEHGSGKTSILRRYCENAFHLSEKSTRDYVRLQKTVRQGTSEIPLEIWDTAGSERLRSLSGAYYREALAVVVVLDVTKGTGLNAALSWFEDATALSPPGIPIFIAANKIDMENLRQLPSEKLQHFFEEKNVPLFEISALSGEQVSQMMSCVVEAAYVISFYIIFAYFSRGKNKIKKKTINRYEHAIANPCFQSDNKAPSTSIQLNHLPRPSRKKIRKKCVIL